MSGAVIEIIPVKPCETKVVIVPLFEQLIEVPADSAVMPRTLAHALYLYAAGEDGHLYSVLQEDERACDFIIQFEATWFVRTELDVGICSAELRETSMAVHLARVVQTQRMASRAADDCQSE